MAKPELSSTAIVDRGLELADAEGLDAVTIRRLAQELGVTPMALYWHVTNKDELLDAMGDRLFGTVDYDAGPDASWAEQLRAVIQGLVDALRRHPACLELAYRRILACPDGQQITEYTLGLLRRSGFTRREAADIATHGLQTAVMLVQAEPGAEPGNTPDDLAARLAAKRAGLQKLPADDFPYIREMADELLHCDDLDDYYHFGVALFITGARATMTEASRPNGVRA